MNSIKNLELDAFLALRKQRAKVEPFNRDTDPGNSDGRAQSSSTDLDRTIERKKSRGMGFD